MAANKARLFLTKSLRNFSTSQAESVDITFNRFKNFLRHLMPFLIPFLARSVGFLPPNVAKGAFDEDVSLIKDSGSPRVCTAISID